MKKENRKVKSITYQQLLYSIIIGAPSHLTVRKKIMSLYDNIDNETVTKEIRITDKDKVICEEYGHPRVYIEVKKKGFGVCGYCNITYKHTDIIESEQIRKIIKKA